MIQVGCSQSAERPGRGLVETWTRKMLLVRAGGNEERYQNWRRIVPVKSAGDRTSVGGQQLRKVDVAEENSR